MLISNYSNLFLVLLFLLSLHACDARRLRFLERSSFVSRLQLRPISRGVRTDQPERSLDKNNSDEVSNSLEIIVGVVEMLKGMKKHRRLVMELPLKDKEKVMNSEENDEVGEDMVVMDYAQPHRKPPIHNEKP